MTFSIKFISTYLAVISMLVICNGCLTENKNIETITLAASDSCIIDGEPEAIRHVDISEDKAAIYNSNDSGFVSVYSYPEFHCLYAYGVKGNSPDEWISKMYGRSDRESEMLAYDIMKGILYQLDITDSAISRKVIATLPQRDGRTIPYGRIDRIGQNLYLAKENDMDGSQLVITDFESQTPSTKYVVPVKSNGRIKGYPFDDFFFAANHERVLVAYENIDLVEILDLTDCNLSLVKRIGVLTDIDSATAGNRDRKRFAMQVTENGGKFFILVPTDGHQTGHLIRMIDTQGNETGRYMLDREVSRIAFDTHGRLIAITENEESNIVYVFTLPS